MQTKLGTHATMEKKMADMTNASSLQIAQGGQIGQYAESK
jgi:hypothetical protein